MSITIREATPEDAEAIARLNAAHDDLRATPAHIAAHIASYSAVERGYLAEVDGQVAGMACLRLLPSLCDPAPSAELTELFVEAGQRKAGVGRALVRHIEGVAAAAGATRLTLITAWRNTEAHAFYHALGYRLWCLAMSRQLEH
ncbi:GNAT family N-acetyltransferase [Oscillochloris sp. ZM17-4]|uniref:GNAT family N-acetyltransferase n=1 Tax=Oscillochloris sp. ZM17-4 TaxID=2866714 RepID=UPI001C73741C|nr:GNAT family N-acetyltransferase [Oscillochloris sp. ZM17-4]MBX0329477.1 GNAT family N-acetyltransferase [Oscillochloris sp. ZM17-4]